MNKKTTDLLTEIENGSVPSFNELMQLLDDDTWNQLNEDDRAYVGDVAQGYYWFLADYHEGQTSERYKQLSIISREYTPGHSESGPEPETRGADVYNVLAVGEVDES